MYILIKELNQPGLKNCCLGLKQQGPKNLSFGITLRKDFDFQNSGYEAHQVGLEVAENQNFCFPEFLAF
jgi:hypothetical protein